QSVTCSMRVLAAHGPPNGRLPVPHKAAHATSSWARGPCYERESHARLAATHSRFCLAHDRLAAAYAHAPDARRRALPRTGNGLLVGVVPFADLVEYPTIDQHGADL